MKFGCGYQVIAAIVCLLLIGFGFKYIFLPKPDWGAQNKLMQEVEKGEPIRIKDVFPGAWSYVCVIYPYEDVRSSPSPSAINAAEYSIENRTPAFVFNEFGWQLALYDVKEKHITNHLFNKTKTSLPTPEGKHSDSCYMGDSAYLTLKKKQEEAGHYIHSIGGEVIPSVSMLSGS